MWLIAIAAVASETSIPEAAPTAGALSAIEARFQRIDRDRNGFITVNEAPRVAAPAASGGSTAVAAASWIQIYDSDGDSRISPAEFLARSLANQASASLDRR